MCRGCLSLCSSHYPVTCPLWRQMNENVVSHVLLFFAEMLFSQTSEWSVLLLSLLCLSCRVRPLSESINDLFREVSLLHRRITELSHRLATLEPFLRRHGYREKGEEAGGGRALAPLSLRGEVASLAHYTPRTTVRVSPSNGSRVVRRRRVRVLKNGGTKLVQGER